MTVRACLVCGRLNTGASYCKRHQPDRDRQRTTPGRTSKRQTGFRAAVLRNADHRCQWVENGVRCERTDHLQAHHTTPLVQTLSFDPGAGVALCPPHHALAERALRDVA